MSALYPSLDTESSVTPGGDQLTPGGDIVMSSSGMVNPSAPPAYVAAPASSSAPAAPADARRLVYVGIRNVVICRDMTNMDAIVDVWKHEMGKPSRVMNCETYVVTCGDVVVAKFGQLVAGLDAMTGAERWRFTMKETGPVDATTIVPHNLVVYLGAKNTVTALSTVNGQVLWEYKFDHFISVNIPVILVCGMCVFIVGASEGVYLNAADGSVAWKTKFSKLRYDMPPSLAWNGENRILLGAYGYVYRCDARTGEQLERVNLKGDLYNIVKMTYDRNRKVFYALAATTLYALSGDDENRILWKCKVPAPALTINTTFSVEPNSGRVYVVAERTLSCIHPTGSVVFSNKFDEPNFVDHIYAVTQDILGSGFIYVGGSGFYFVADGEGRIVHSDTLPGMRYGQTYLCTRTSSIDSNACFVEVGRLAWSGYVQH